MTVDFGEPWDQEEPRHLLMRSQVAQQVLHTCEQTRRRDVVLNMRQDLPATNWYHTQTLVSKYPCRRPSDQPQGPATHGTPTIEVRPGAAARPRRDPPVPGSRNRHKGFPPGRGRQAFTGYRLKLIKAFERAGLQPFGVRSDCTNCRATTARWSRHQGLPSANHHRSH